MLIQDERNRASPRSRFLYILKSDIKEEISMKKLLALLAFLVFLFSCTCSQAGILDGIVKMDVVHDEIPTYMTSFVSQGYSLGESGPVRFTFIRNIKDSERKTMKHYLPESDKDVYTDTSILIYNPEMQTYPSDTNIRSCTEEDFTIESHNEDYSEIVIRFRTPGYYSILDSAEFYVLDPADETLSALAAEMDAMIAKAKEKSKTEKALAKAICDWINKKVKYPAKNWLEYDFEKQCNYNNIVGALLGGECMCPGFAAITKALLSQAGLRCTNLGGLIRRTSEMHEWNFCRLDGEWVHIDTGWGKFALNTDSILKDRALFDNDYFLLYEWFWTCPADRLLDETDMVIPYHFVM